MYLLRKVHVFVVATDWSLLRVCLVCSLAPLVSKVKEPQVEVMVDSLCSNMTSSKEQLRDISSMGLKAVIAELPLTSSGEGCMSSQSG